MRSVEDDAQLSDSHYLLQTKETLVALWHELPSEHQATMLLVLLKDLLHSEYQTWILDAIQRLYLNGKGADGMD